MSRAGLAPAWAAIAAAAGIILCTGSVARAQEAGEVEPGAHAPRDTTFVLSVRSTLPPYRFTVRHDPATGSVTRVEIAREDHPEAVQVLEGLTAEEPPPGGVDDVAAEDVNFDGYADLRVLAMWGATGNRTYDWFLFDPAAGRFVPEPALSDLVNPVPDPATETIRTRAGGGMAGLVYGEGTYRWEGGAPVCVRLLRQDWDPARSVFARVIEEIRGDTLAPVRRGVAFEGEVTRGETFSFPITDSLKFVLDPFPGGWEIVVRAADRPEENLARLTPPLHGPNPRQILGWHFERDGAGGASERSRGAPQRERDFIFSEKVGRSIQGPESDRAPTPEEIDEVARDGSGTLTIEDMRIPEPKPGQDPEIEWMRFSATVDFP